MSDKTENLISALEHIRKAMGHTEDAACILLTEHKAGSVEYGLLDDLYSVLVQAEQKLIRLKD